MRVFFHIRRLDGALERDTIGLDVPADRLAFEAMEGAKGLICEAIDEERPLEYATFEVESYLGVSVLDFSFDHVLRLLTEGRSKQQDRRNASLLLPLP